MRPLVHPLAAWRVRHGWRRREDERAVLHKGKSTEKIWYCDLSDVKVGKKTPLTLRHFEDFAAKLATREDSERSWTLDLSARKAKAAADAQPFKDTARAKSQEAERTRDRVGELKKAKPRNEPAISAKAFALRVVGGIIAR